MWLSSLNILRLSKYIQIPHLIQCYSKKRNQDVFVKDNGNRSKTQVLFNWESVKPTIYQHIEFFYCNNPIFMNQ